MSYEQGFVEILSIVGKPIDKKNGKYLCPLCDKRAFTVSTLKNSSKCHACGKYGDPITWYSYVLGVDYDEARERLLERVGKAPIRRWKTIETIGEARDKIAKDLEFLSWVKMYIAFNDGTHRNKGYYSNRCGVNQTIFSRVINGNIEDVSFENWEKVVSTLRHEIDIDKFKRVLNSKNYFKNIVKTTFSNEQLIKFIRKDSKDE